MKHLLILAFLLIAILNGYAQNLIPNPSFEDHTGCPNTWSQITSAISWLSANNATPDYFNSCSATGPFRTPVNIMGNQTARTGVAYSGLILSYDFYNLNYREYLEVQLTTPLSANECYHFEMFVNLSDRVDFSTDDIGIFFSPALILSPIDTVLNFTPQIENVSGNYFNSTTWTNVSGDYTATGGERYIIIGNFKDSMNTSLLYISNPGVVEYSYCYIDDISLISCTNILPIELLNFSALQLNNSIELAWTTATETNNDYFIIERSSDAENFTEINKVDGAGNSTKNLKYKSIDENPLNGISYYRLKQVDFDGKYSYSKIIDINFFGFKDDIRIDPNPAFSETKLIFPEVLKGETKIELFNSQGKSVLKLFENNEMSSYLLNLEAFEKGVYFISIENNDQHFKSKLIVN